jgi:hypothetical protein
LFGESNRAGADELVALLGPNATAAGVNPSRTNLPVVARPADDGGIAVPGERDRKPLEGGGDRAAADKLLPCWVQRPWLLRVKTHAAPVALLSICPPTIAVLPSLDSATEVPWRASPTAPVPISFSPCWVQRPWLLRVKTHAAPGPMPGLSLGPPTMAVLPSPESATEVPCAVDPTAPRWRSPTSRRNAASKRSAQMRPGARPWRGRWCVNGGGAPYIPSARAANARCISPMLAWTEFMHVAPFLEHLSAE